MHAPSRSTRLCLCRCTAEVPTTAKMGIDATIPENIPAERYTRIVYFNQGKD